MPCSPASPRSSGTFPASPGSSADAQVLPALGGKKRRHGSIIPTSESDEGRLSNTRTINSKDESQVPSRAQPDKSGKAIKGQTSTEP